MGMNGGPRGRLSTETIRRGTVSSAIMLSVGRGGRRSARPRLRRRCDRSPRGVAQKNSPEGVCPTLLALRSGKSLLGLRELCCELHHIPLRRSPAALAWGHRHGALRRPPRAPPSPCGHLRHGSTVYATLHLHRLSAQALVGLMDTRACAQKPGVI